MAVNVELLDRTLAYIEGHPAHWNQQMWRCNTGMCFAGWAVQLAGDAVWPYPACDPNEESLTLSLRSELVIASADDPDADVFREDGVEVVRIEDRARRLLGLDDNQTEDLFDWLNTLDDLRRIVADIKAGAS